MIFETAVYLLYVCNTANKQLVVIKAKKLSLTKFTGFKFTLQPNGYAIVLCTMQFFEAIYPTVSRRKNHIFLVTYRYGPISLKSIS